MYTVDKQVYSSAISVSLGIYNSLACVGIPAVCMCTPEDGELTGLMMVEESFK